ncbi:P-loop containing nucleoside triphosphate hydrolase protein [Lentithecium fluviatile CBS 122367]|uniref:P-loop containing nucleoside triphosphate hydrolase protein n=1 Tax=Lentithecium fluviatile CBS 122367 TaxID=1168545 RepID=A0A6G1IRK3_9PLEO|nr:P-loop containing nucleoside triphosphate hydrolase protein [Lentithecium fluviatile CBS 122367]
MSQPTTRNDRSTKEVPNPKFEFAIDGPGNLSPEGPRHDNDSEDIRKIRIFPTHQEIASSRNPYLPSLDSSQLHLPGMDGLVDRHFRLYREDIVSQLRDAVKFQLDRQNNSGTKAARLDNSIRTYVYRNMEFKRLHCDRSEGLVVTIAIDQPQILHAMMPKSREDWWASTNRLQCNSLVCLLNPAGHAIFGTVVEQPIRRDHHGDGDEEKDVSEAAKETFPWRDLHSNGRQAILSMVLADEKDARIIAEYYTGRKSNRGLTLLEFPKVLIQAFQPTLASLQSMIGKKDLPFTDLLASSGEHIVSHIEPPVYSKQEGFRFDLSCLTSENTPLALSPNQPFDLQELVKSSSLDEKQGEALVHALTRRLAIIQGPPGTGKSFTSVALIRALLAARKQAELGPILLVTYTNHACDAVLEKCLDHGIQKVIRIGSRSKSGRLENLNLRFVSRTMERTALERREAYGNAKALRHDTAFVNETIDDLANSGNAKGLEGYLKDNYPQYHRQFWGKDDEGFQIVASKKPYITAWLYQKLSNTSRPNRTIEELLESQTNIWDMTSSERGGLYRYWVNDCQNIRKRQFRSSLKTYWRTRRDQDAARQEVDLRCLEQADIIGITTSGLARNLNLLKYLPIKSLFVEEAGEVLEAHTLTALLPSVEHAILIGDHLQLKPSVNNYDLSSESVRGKRYCLDMSTFERLVSPLEDMPGIKLPYSTLQTQRRMHPSISALIRETLYAALEDGPNVALYPEVVGMKKRLYWLDHSIPEAGSEDNEQFSTSKSNDFEVLLVVCLVAHLLSQGVYGPKDIAVITPYLGQLFKLRRALSEIFEVELDDQDEEALQKSNVYDNAASTQAPADKPKKTSLLEALKIATVDNFQGEEAKVVVVSLVRSNKDNNCGFLKTSNRINVLLSRAKHGMYIIGNSRTSASVPMWSKVLEVLEQQGNIGTSLALCCPRHPDTVIEVAEPADFEQFAPEGGCALKCDRRLKCGHACTQMCHSELRHNDVICYEPCPRMKPACDHVCKKICGVPCDRQCEELLKGINVTLPCGHVIKDLRCWENQAQSSLKCTVLAEKLVTNCGHVVKVKCHVDVNADDYICKVDCGGKLKCGHLCRTTCYQCAIWGEGERLHADCKSKCDKPFMTCNHKCMATCHDGVPCGTCQKQCEANCSHSRCDKRCGEPCNPCAQEDCGSACPHSKCSMPCAAPCDWIPCSKRCSKNLRCGHQCPSLCGEVCPIARYCQVCGEDAIKNMQVDFVEMTQYKDVDPDKDPIIVPRCGHAMTMSNMDGTLGIASVYDLGICGNIEGIKKSGPFSSDELKSLPGCPTCRGSLRSINRYGRLVRRVILDESTKRFVTSAGMQFGPLMERFLKTQKEFVNIPFAPTNSRPLNFRGSRHDQFRDISAITTGEKRYDEIKECRLNITRFFRKVHRDESPFARIWNLVNAARRRAGKTDEMDLQSPVSNVAFHIMALALLIRCDIALLVDVLAEFGKLRKGPLPPKIQVDLSKNRDECTKFIEDAWGAKDMERCVEGHIFFARYCAMEIPFATSSETENNLTTLGLKHLAVVEALCKENNTDRLNSLLPEVQDAKVSLIKKTFTQTVSSDERRSILAAMAKEFRGRGPRWYVCCNGHPFSVGQCGRPMEEAECPQCGETIGGKEHRPGVGVSVAEGLEEELRSMKMGGR